MKRPAPKKRISNVVGTQVTNPPRFSGDDPGITEGSAFNRGFSKKKPKATKITGPLKAVAHGDPWDS